VPPGGVWGNAPCYLKGRKKGYSGKKMIDDAVPRRFCITSASREIRGDEKAGKVKGLSSAKGRFGGGSYLMSVKGGRGGEDAGKNLTRE